jgi:hypothetical protein
MLLGQKLQHSMNMVGQKKVPQVYLGNKIDSTFGRRQLPVSHHNVAQRTSPIEKYHINNH